MVLRILYTQWLEKWVQFVGEEEINLEREGENSEHVYGLLACRTLKQIHQKPKTVFIFKNEVKKKVNIKSKVV